MKRGIVGLFFVLGMMISSTSQANVLVALFNSMKGVLGADVNYECVLNCLREPSDAQVDCKRADLIECQYKCHNPTPATFVLGTSIYKNNIELESPSKLEGAIESYSREIGVEPDSTQTYFVSTISDLAIRDNIPLPMSVTLVHLGINTQPPFDPETQWVTTQGTLKCTASKSVTYSDGSTGVGCREIPANGTSGWRAQGCIGSLYDSYCCNRTGTDGRLGSGSCYVPSSVDSIGGNGIY